MIIKLDSELKTLEGERIVNTPEEKDKNGEVTKATTYMSIKSVCTNALLGVNPQEKVQPDEKFKRYELTMTIKAAKKEVELTIEDVALLKKLVGEVYPPLIMGQVWVALEDNKKKDA